MLKKFGKSSKKVGLPPGTIVYTEKKKKTKTRITIIDYNEIEFSIKEIKQINESINQIDESFIRWINVVGIENTDIINDLGHIFELHPLLLEDVVNPHQRPKYEEFKDYIFIVLKKLILRGDRQLETEQISIVLGKNYVISFQEQETNLFNPILNRIKIPKGLVRKMGADYLTYALVDIVIDNYFVVEESIGEIIEDIEEELIESPKLETLQAIYKLKRQITELRKSVWPLREVINKLQREQSPLIGDELGIYLRDIYDHIFRIYDSLQDYRDIISGMLDMYLSSVSNKMNEIMKVLTIISTIFIPLSFLAGFYGMNFLYMPELKIPTAYPLLIIVMVLIAAIMLVFFKRKKWL
ncbi:MAG: magnesium/cobalt transporter CorA [Promethearchaeota archaeon]|nr:MAG: magnesium/cobalt transporter CorA [Candidatus Lokiarchaeota archaeon]